MKHRGLRVTLTAGAIGLVIVVVIVAFNWGVVRDHVGGYTVTLWWARGSP